MHATDRLQGTIGAVQSGGAVVMVDLPARIGPAELSIATPIRCFRRAGTQGRAPPSGQRLVCGHSIGAFRLPPRRAASRQRTDEADPTSSPLTPAA